MTSLIEDHYDYYNDVLTLKPTLIQDRVSVLLSSWKKENKHSQFENNKLKYYRLQNAILNWKVKTLIWLGEGIQVFI